MNNLYKLICLPVLIFSLTAVAQDNKVYLQQNSTLVTPDSLNTSRILNQSFYDHQLFLIGEIHGIQKGQEIDFDFLTLLNRKINVKTYVGEIDFAKAYFLNQYLRTGNEALVDSVFKDWTAQDAQWANKDFQDKIRKIRAYNQTLKVGRRIHFEGIDQIQNPTLVAEYLKILLKGKPAVLKTTESLLAALQMKNDSLISMHAKSLLNTLDLGHRLKAGNVQDDNFRFALINCMQINAPREAQMYVNFKRLYTMRGWAREKLYGFFGFAHVLGAKANGGRSVSVAYLLEHDADLQLKDKVASIGLLYVDSKMTTPSIALPVAWRQKGARFSAIGQYNHDGPLVKLEDIESFKSASQPFTITLFDLAATRSPYLNRSLAIKYADMMPTSQRLMLDAPGVPITEYLRYVILVRNSEGTRPILP